MEHAAANQPPLAGSTTIAPPPFEDIERRRFSVLELLIEPEVGEHDYAAHPPLDEDLPAYESINLPEYEERHLQAPVVSYCLYQITRKVQILTPATVCSIDRPRYRLAGRGSPSLFSKKADFTLTRLPAGRAAALGDCPEQDVAFMNFDRNGPLPWMPRACLVQGNCPASRTSYSMSAANFQDWKIDLKNNSQPFTWRLADNPTSLILVEHSSNSIVARFSYSRFGTDATRGAEVGQLDVYGGSRSGDQNTIEVVISSCHIVMHHLKNMGRHYKNIATPMACSASTARLGNSFLSGNSPFEVRRSSHAV